jgi:hypothetical protein
MTSPATAIRTRSTKETHHGACHVPGHRAHPGTLRPCHVSCHQAHPGTLRASNSHCCSVNNRQCAFKPFLFTDPVRVYSAAEAIHWPAACHLISPFPSFLQPAFQHLETSWTRFECSVVDIPYGMGAKITKGRGPGQLDIVRWRALLKALLDGTCCLSPFWRLQYRSGS